MLNAIKMDLYRMARSKSFYAVLLLLALFLVLSVGLTKEDMEYINEHPQEAVNQPAESKVNLGMYLDVPMEAGEQVTVSDEVYAHLSCKFIAIFAAVFAALFATADIKSGYIKNIGGQVRSRMYLIVSKVLALAVFTAIVLAVSVLTIAAASQIVFGYVSWGNPAELLPYLGVQYLLYTAFVLIVMCMAILLKHNSITMTLAVCMCLNILMIIYGMVNKGAARLGLENFDVSQYVVTGNIAYLPLEMDADLYARGILAALCFMAASIAISIVVMRKRDI